MLEDDADRSRATLAGKRAIVTGAARGIGLGTVARLVDAGADVLAVDILAKEGSAAIAVLGTRATFHAMDVTRESDWSDLASSLADTPPDVLVNNAGGLLSADRLHEQSLEVWQQTIALNLTSVFLGMRAVIPLMVQRRAGAIVNIGSVSGVIGQRDAAAYQAAKAGVHVLTRNAAMTYARDGIRVNTISPSVIFSRSAAAEPDARTKAFLTRVPMGRSGCPGDVAEAVLYLASDAASYVTGVNLPVDGGYLA